MAELGIIASVVQIADVGLNLSVKLCTFGETVATADKSITLISKDVSSTSVVLKELGHILDKDRDSRLCSENVIHTADEVVKECLGIFEEMDRVLVKRVPFLRAKEGEKGERAKRAKMMLERLKWPYLQPKLLLLQSNLDRLKSTLLLMLNVIIYARQKSDKTESPEVVAGQETLIEDLYESREEYIRKFEGMKLSIENGAAYHLNNDTEDIGLAAVTMASPRYSAFRTPLIANDSFALGKIENPRNVSFETKSESVPNQNGQDILQLLLKHYERLMHNLLQEVQAPAYEIPDDSRSRIMDDIISTHTRERRQTSTTHRNGSLGNSSCAPMTPFGSVRRGNLRCKTSRSHHQREEDSGESAIRPEAERPIADGNQNMQVIPPSRRPLNAGAPEFKPMQQPIQPLPLAQQWTMSSSSAAAGGQSVPKVIKYFLQSNSTGQLEKGTYAGEQTNKGQVRNSQWNFSKESTPGTLQCTACRLKRIKCDRDEPKCVQCKKYGRGCSFQPSAERILAPIDTGPTSLERHSMQVQVAEPSVSSFSSYSRSPGTPAIGTPRLSTASAKPSPSRYVPWKSADHTTPPLLSRMSGPTSPNTLRHNMPSEGGFMNGYDAYSQAHFGSSPYDGHSAYGRTPYGSSASHGTSVLTSPYQSTYPTNYDTGRAGLNPTFSSSSIYDSYKSGSRGSVPPSNPEPVIIEARKKPQCWDHGCNGRQFSTFSNLFRHQREKSGKSPRSVCHRCGADFTRKTALDGHLAHDKCKSSHRSKAPSVTEDINIMKDQPDPPPSPVSMPSIPKVYLCVMEKVELTSSEKQYAKPASPSTQDDHAAYNQDQVAEYHFSPLNRVDQIVYSENEIKEQRLRERFGQRRQHQIEIRDRQQPSVEFSDIPGLENLIPLDEYFPLEPKDSGVSAKAGSEDILHAPQPYDGGDRVRTPTVIMRERRNRDARRKAEAERQQREKDEEKQLQAQEEEDLGTCARLSIAGLAQLVAEGEQEYDHDSARDSPRQSITHSVDEPEDQVHMGASGLPQADDPIPERIHSESDISSNPSIIMGSYGLMNREDTCSPPKDEGYISGPQPRTHQPNPVNSFSRLVGLDESHIESESTHIRHLSTGFQRQQDKNRSVVDELVALWTLLPVDNLVV